MSKVEVTAVPYEQAALSLLHNLGIPYEGPGDEMVQHAKVMCEALALIEEKRVGYGQAWKKYGYLGTLLKAGGRMERLINLLWYSDRPQRTRAEMTESVQNNWIDLLVYACFGLQQWRWGDPLGRP